MSGRKVAPGAFLGWPKPDFTKTKKTNKTFDSHYRGALMYAHYEMNKASLKKEALKYLKAHKHPLYEEAKECNEFCFITVGKYYYILNHGGDVPDSVSAHLDKSLEKIINEEKARVQAQINGSLLEEEENESAQGSAKVASISIQDRLRERAREVAGEIEGWLDDLIIDRKSPVKTVEEFVTLFKANDLKSPHMKYMRVSFTKRAELALAVAEGKDKELNEGYSSYTKPELKKFSQFYQNILQAADMMQEAAKATRAPKKRKPVSQEKLVSKLKYKKEDPALGIASVNPTQILGAKELWVYNTKTRKLAQYKALDIAGLMVKGTSIENFSTESKEKTLRKPAETLADFKKASKVKLRTFLDELTTVDTTPNGKLNEHYVILRVDK